MKRTLVVGYLFISNLPAGPIIYSSLQKWQFVIKVCHDVPIKGSFLTAQSDRRRRTPYIKVRLLVVSIF